MESALDPSQPVSKEKGGEMTGERRNIIVKVRKGAASSIREGSCHASGMPHVVVQRTPKAPSSASQRG